MGPLLFIIYLNDLEKYLKFSRAIIYADDTNITIASDDVAKLAEDNHHELSNLTERMRVKKLTPNPKKTEFMTTGHPLKTKNLDQPEVLKLNDCDVKRVDKTKDPFTLHRCNFCTGTEGVTVQPTVYTVTSYP